MMQNLSIHRFLYSIIEQEIDIHVKKLEQQISRPIYRYVMLPGGKFFRPILFLTMLYDLFIEIQSKGVSKKSFESFLSFLKKTKASSLAIALEFHHTYTLIHDDLPCMDNDDYRRERLSAHKKFSDWQALLAGDGLLNYSYQLLTEVKISSAKLVSLLAEFSFLMGPLGLIEGQYLDLSIQKENQEEKKRGKSFQDLLQIHILKTAPLIIFALQAPFSFFQVKNEQYDKYDKNFKADVYDFSKNLGLYFQLKDDKEDKDDSQSKNTLDFNLHQTHPLEVDALMKKIHQNFEKFFIKYSFLHETENFIKQYIHDL